MDEEETVTSELEQTDEVASEPENLMDTPEAETETSESEEAKPDWFQKRMNEITAQKNAAKDEVAELRAQVSVLQKNQGSDAKKDPEISDGQLKSELKKAAEEGDWEYFTQVNDYMNKQLISKEKDSILSEQNKNQTAQSQKVTEWNGLVGKYGKYGLDKGDSQLFKLSKAIFENNPGFSQSVAVSEAFRIMHEEGAINSGATQVAEQQLIKERRRNSLGSGVKGTVSKNADRVSQMTEDQFNKDYIRRMIDQESKLRNSL